MLDDHPFPKGPRRQHHPVEPERLHRQSGDLRTGHDVPGPERVEAFETVALPFGGLGQVPGEQIDRLGRENRRRSPVDAGEAKRQRRRRDRRQILCDVRQCAKCPRRRAHDVPRLASDPSRQRTQQRKCMHPEGGELVGIGRILSHETASEPGCTDRKALGEFGPLVLAAGDLETAATDIEHEQPAGRKGRPAPRREVRETAFFGAR